MTTEQLKNEISLKLGKLIDNDYCLLGVPIHNNVGDNAIWQGEIDFLKTIKNVRQKYSCSYRFFDPKKIDVNDIIIIQGGGHFGDLFKKLQDFKNNVVKNFKDNKIIIFPVSVYFGDQKYLKKTVDIFSSHENVTICARDIGAYGFLKEHFRKNSILLVPDMALFMDAESLTDVPATKNQKEIKKILFLERDDKELKEKPDFAFPKNFTRSGWSKADEGSLLTDLRNLTNREIGRIFRFLNIDYNNEYGFLKLSLKKRERYIQAGLNYLRNFDLVITQRLHGHILSTMLGIPNIMLDINYGKGRDFYKTWTKSVPNAYFAYNMDELRDILKINFNIII